MRAFYEYTRMHMEPWDGPAGIVLTDGRYAACTLVSQRAWRPARWVLTKDRILTIRVRSGCVADRSGNVERKGRVKPVR